eukprot:1028055-Pleurochrysis_carterae.AAC.4
MRREARLEVKSTPQNPPSQIGRCCVRAADMRLDCGGEHVLYIDNAPRAPSVSRLLSASYVRAIHCAYVRQTHIYCGLQPLKWRAQSMP